MPSWIKVQLMKRYPSILKDGRADLDGNGRIDPNERFRDFDGDGAVGNSKDFTIYFNVKANRAAIEKNVPFFTWAKVFRMKNLLTHALSIESDFAAAADIKSAFTFLTGVLAAARQLAKTKKLSAADLYNLLVKKGVRISSTNDLLSQGIGKRSLTPDAIHIMIVGLAWELGITKIRPVVLPSATCIKEGRTYYKVEHGPALRRASFKTLRREFLIPRSAFKRRAYLWGLNRKRTRGQIYYRYGDRALKMKSYAAAVKFFVKALRLYPAHVGTLRGLGTAHYYLGNTAAAETYLTKAIKIDPKDELSYFMRVRVWLKLGDGQRARLDLARSCKPRGARRRPVHPRCFAIRKSHHRP
jgi:tetratricopeptide (TPR) repeat protein